MINLIVNIENTIQTAIKAYSKEISDKFNELVQKYVEEDNYKIEECGAISNCGGIIWWAILSNAFLQSKPDVTKSSVGK